MREQRGFLHLKEEPEEAFRCKKSVKNARINKVLAQIIFLRTWRGSSSSASVSRRSFYVTGLLTLATHTPDSPFLVRTAHVSTWRLTSIYRNRIPTCERGTARPPCSHLNMSFGCFLRGLRFARWVSLFVVWVYVGWWRGVAHGSVTWQEQCCFWERVKCSKYSHWVGP